MAAALALVTGNMTTYQLVLLVVASVQELLMDAVAESLMGLKWQAMLQHMQMASSWRQAAPSSYMANRAWPGQDTC
jgi:uncharacterized protein (DUF2062 family)